MLITNFNNYKSQYSIQNKNPQLIKTYPCDLVTFSGKKDNLADDPELDKALKQVSSRIDNIIKKTMKNFINGGYTADFYDLRTEKGDSLGYVLAIPKTVIEEVKNGSYKFKGQFKEVEDEYPGFNVGQCIAECRDLRIHKKLNGTPGGIIYNTEGKTPEERWNYTQNCIFTNKHLEQYKKHLGRLEQLTNNQECFDDFAKEILELSEKHMFDLSPNNILIDVKNKKINIFNPTTRKNTKKNQCQGNLLADIVGCLFDAKFVLRQSEQSRQRLLQKSPTDENLNFIEIRKKVLKNCLLAARKANMSFKHDLSYFFEISGLSKDDMQKIIEASKKNNKIFNTTLGQVFNEKS